MKRPVFPAILLLLTALPRAVPDTAVPDTVVVCPAGFHDALGPWMRHRSQQGHTLVLVSNAAGAEGIRRRIRDVAKSGRLRFVVLIGDAQPALDHDQALRARCVPVHHAKAEVNTLWGSEPQIATDNWYADLDGDKMPEIAIGRLTADTPEELRQIVAKILAYERSTDFGPWRRRLNFVAGLGGFGPLVDTLIESTTRFFLTVGVPPDYQLSMTHGSWRSPYCPDPRRFHETTLRRLNEGSWFWVYIGHGRHRSLDRVRVPGERYHILGANDVAKLDCRHGAPIALFLACYTGAFDAPSDCLAERMLREADGPVAIIAGSRVTMPYGMAVMAGGLMDECFRHRASTLGEAILGAKRKMMKQPAGADHQRAILDTIAAAVSPAPKKLAAERAEHVLLFNLIGDPLLRLRYPKRIALGVPPAVTAGEPFQVTGVCPVDGRGTLELVVRRDRLTFKPPSRSVYPKTSGALAEFQETYQRANDRRLKSVDVTVQGGRLATQLDVPEEADGQCHVRVFIQGAGDFAMGAANVTVRREPSE